jgi:hypothetical protein
VHEQVDARLQRRDLAGAERHRDGGWALGTFSFGFFAIASSRTRHRGDGHNDVQVKVHFLGDARQIPTTTTLSFSPRRRLTERLFPLLHSHFPSDLQS